MEYKSIIMGRITRYEHHIKSGQMRAALGCSKSLSAWYQRQLISLPEEILAQYKEKLSIRPGSSGMIDVNELKNKVNTLFSLLQENEK